MTHDKIRLGKGEFEHIHRNGLTLSVKDARDYFLYAVKDVKPEVLDDLANEPFKLYKEAGLAFDSERYEKEFENLEFYDRIREMSRLQSLHRWNHPDWYGHYENIEVDYNPKIRAMQKSIFDWSKRYNLNVDWCRSRAYETLDYWHKNSRLYEARRWNDDTSLEPIIATHRGELDFVFSIRSTYPTFGFRADEERRIMEACKRELMAFLDKREQLAKKNGMVKPKKKNKYQHFIWLAKYQLDESLTHEKIAQQVKRENSVDVQAVTKAINEVAKLIVLPLRKAKRGRKPKILRNVVEHNEK